MNFLGTYPVLIDVNLVENLQGSKLLFITALHLMQDTEIASQILNHFQQGRQTYPVQLCRLLHTETQTLWSVRL